MTTHKRDVGLIRVLAAALCALGAQQAAAAGPGMPLPFPLPAAVDTTPPGQARHPARDKIGEDLDDLAEAYERPQARRGRGHRPHHEHLPVRDGGVVIDAAAAGDPQALLAELEAWGLRHGTVAGRLVSGVLPIGSLRGAAASAALKFARPALAVTKSGAALSQGDWAVHADVVRTSVPAFDGSGVTVGVLSDSYDCLGGAAAGTASGDLPPVRVLAEAPCIAGVTDEGRAMAEIIHDLAPGANIAFHTAWMGAAGFANGIAALVKTAGARVLVDDIGYLGEPFFQDGVIAQAVDAAAAANVAYFSAAGNFARQSYESQFRPSARTMLVNGRLCTLHDFDPGPGDVPLQGIRMSGGSSMLVFQWDEPYFSVPNGRGSASDLDLLAFDAAGGLVAWSTSPSVGGDPLEMFSWYSFDPVYLAIAHCQGTAPSRMKYVLRGVVQGIDFATDSGTIIGQANAAGAMAVGAAFHETAPYFSGAPTASLESYSSAGGTPIVLDTLGNRLDLPQVRHKPDFVAPDGVDTSFFPCAACDADGNGKPNFFGTSAAAPHAAAIAALVLQKEPLLTPAGLADLLGRTSLDMDDPATVGPDPGFDYGTGFGFLQADAAVAGIGVAPVPAPVAPSLVVPPDLVLEASGPDGAVATFTATARDASGTLPVTCTPPSGSTFPLGAGNVGCEATASTGEVLSASFIVTVRDTTPPVLTVPAGLTAVATGVTGAAVSYGVSAADLVSGAVTATCAPASGSVFPLGSSTVICQAGDLAGNVATAGFTVTVTDNTPPLARDDAARTTTGVPVVINVVANDRDAEGNLDPGTVTIAAAPRRGGAVANGDGTVTYSPPAGFRGDVKFSYTVRDTAGAVSRIAKVVVMVTR